MRRFENRTKTPKRFIELSVQGRFALTSRGIIDKTHVTEKVEWSDSKTANDQIELAAKKALKAGFKLVSETADVDPVAERSAKNKAKAKSKDRASLVNAIRNDLTDSEAWLVYADALQADGDPRGELVVLQEKLAKKPNDRALRKAEEALLREHEEDFYGPLLLEMDDKDPYVRDDLFALDLTWRNGYFQKAAIRGFSDQRFATFGGEEGEEPLDLDETHAVRLLTSLLDQSSAMFLESLDVMSVIPEGYFGIIDRLANIDPAPPLRTLELRPHVLSQNERATYDAKSIDALLKAYPHLERLRLWGDFEEITKLNGFKTLAASLTQLEIERAHSGVVQSILRAGKWPKLEKLVLWLGNTSADMLAPLFAAKDFPKLTHLGLVGSARGDEIAKAVADSKLAAQLRHLDLARGTVTGSGVRSLTAAKKKKKGFAKLETIDLRFSYLSDDARAALEGLAPEILDTNQRFGTTLQMEPM